MKPDPLPVARNGFCQGCKRFDVRLNLVTPNGRYRCDACSAGGNSGGNNPEPEPSDVG